jgi:hypothetical protein
MLTTRVPRRRSWTEGWSWLAAGRADLAEPLLHHGAESGFTNSMALVVALPREPADAIRLRRSSPISIDSGVNRWIPSFDRAIVHKALGGRTRSLVLCTARLHRASPS